jgi:hypothetical protein
VSIDRASARLAARQHGLITVFQLRDLGMTRGMLRARVEAGRLTLVRRFVYAIAGVPPSWPQTVLAAVLAADCDAMASHQTAGALWGLQHCDHDTVAGRLHLTAPRSLRLAGVMGHIRRVEAGQRRVRLAIPVTSPHQTIVDLAAILTARQLGECVDDAVRRDLIRLDRLRRIVTLAGGSGRRPIRPLRLVLADRKPGYDPGANDWQKEMDRKWDEWGLPAAIPQYRVTANNKKYRLDRAIPELKIGVEWNGFGSHGTRSGFDYDSNKRADLTAEGWHMLDFTYRSSQDRICRAVLAAVARRRQNDVAATLFAAQGRGGGGGGPAAVC